MSDVLTERDLVRHYDAIRKRGCLTARGAEAIRRRNAPVVVPPVVAAAEAPPIAPPIAPEPSLSEPISGIKWLPVQPAERELQPAIKQIQRAVCAHYKCSMLDLLSQRRTKPIVDWRQVAMYLAKTMTLRSLPEIGRKFGGRDHTTVLHAVRKIGRRVDDDAGFAAEIETIRNRILAQAKGENHE